MRKHRSDESKDEYVTELKHEEKTIKLCDCLYDSLLQIIGHCGQRN